MNVRAIESQFIQKIKPLAKKDLYDQLQSQTVMLVTTSRHSAEWKRLFAEWQMAQGNLACTTPDILTWDSWLGQLARDCADIPVPLNRLQEMQLWEQIVDADMAGAGNTASARGLARHAAEAYSMLREYRIDMDELAGAGEEAEALKRWIASMQSTLKQEGRVLTADLPELLLPHIASAIREPRLLLDGFDRITPMQQSLLQALQEHGIDLLSVARADTPVTTTLTACPDAETEYRHIARKIADTVQSDPHARIGVIISRQVKDAETLRRILDESLLSPAEQVSSTGTLMQSVVMAGRPLATAPLIRQLLDLLHLAGRSGAPYKALSPLLFSPGIKGYAKERFTRASLDAGLREHNRHYLNFKSLLAMEEMAAMPQLADVLRSLLAWETNTRPASAWVKSVHILLQATGFLQANTADRNSSEIRQLNAFRECLASLVAIDVVRKKTSWNDFLSLLVSACNEICLSGPVRHPQVSVVPLEQIAGHGFDQIFAAGFDDDALPLPARPIPLLPLPLQRRHQLPGSTAALAFTESEALWQQLLQAAPAVHLSFAEAREERELRPSPFLAGVDIRQCSCAAQAPEVAATEQFEDAPAVPLSAQEHIRGGSAIIRNQSACPFRAFASHRLNLVPLGETAPGVTPADKGSLLHEALQYIWEKLRSQVELLALDEAAATALIDEAVESAWHQARVATPESTQQFERRRMAGVLAAWLEIERQRPSFIVERCEKPYRLELPESGTVRFAVRLKADRIDRDVTGHKILIDYKTGQKQSIGKWIGERMAEPQLPLYAMAEELEENDAVCFARVRSGDMGFEGLSGEATDIKGIAVYKGNDEEAESWPELLECWHRRIDALASEFVDGRCEVTPQDAKACSYCGLEAVCRIDEIGIDRDEEEDAA